MGNKVKWKLINYCMDQIKHNRGYDDEYVQSLLCELGEEVPSLIEHIQKLAKEKNEYKRKYENVLNLKCSGTIKQNNNNWMVWNNESYHSILPYQQFTYDPKFIHNVWLNPTLRDSI